MPFCAGYLGWALASAGRTDEGIVFSEQAIRMSPHDPQNAIFNNALAVVNYLAGRYTEAVNFARKAVQQVALHMSAFGGKADMPFCNAYVCF